jgi:hypothetical protein
MVGTNIQKTKNLINPNNITSSMATPTVSSDNSTITVYGNWSLEVNLPVGKYTARVSNCTINDGSGERDISDMWISGG